MHKMRFNGVAKVTRGILVGSVALLAVIATLPISGCGGGSKIGGGNSSSLSRGAVTFSVVWPDKKNTRVIPLATESIRVELTRIEPGPAVGILPTVPLLTPPPDTQATDRKSETTISNLELGTYRFVVTAYPNADGTGTPLATATVDHVVVAGDNDALTVVMNATVTQTLITVGPPQSDEDFDAINNNSGGRVGLGVGKRVQLFATMFDSQQRIVLVDSLAITWSSSNTGVATVGSDGLVETVGLGNATIRAVYKEPYTDSGVEGTGASTSVDFSVVAGIAGSAWPKSSGDLQNSKQALSGGSTEGEIFWQYTTEDSIVFSSPAVAGDGTVYVGSYDTYFYAINPDGSLRWRFKTGDIIESSPAIASDGTVYFGSMDGNVYALDGMTGELKWQFAAGSPVFASPTISTNGLLIIGCIEPVNKLYALDLNTGIPAWEYTAGDAIQTCPALSPDFETVYFGSLDGNLYALDVTNGAERWIFATGDAILTSSPAVTRNGVIYVGTLGGTLFAVQADGTALPGFTPVQTNAAIFSSPAIALDGTVYFGTLDSFTGLDDNTLFAVDGATGNLRWRFAIDAPISSSPAIGADRVIYFGALNGNVYAVNPDGVVKWELNVGGGDPIRDDIESSPAIGEDGTIYIGGLSGIVSAIK